jgi:hypothetical protein
MDAMFLLIEARRHSLYYFSQRRVTALERGFFAHVLLANAVCSRGSSAPALRPVPSLDMSQRWDGVVQLVGLGASAGAGTGPGAGAGAWTGGGAGGGPSGPMPGPSPAGPGWDQGDAGMATIGMATATAGMATVTGGLFTLELEQWDAALKALMLAPPGWPTVASVFECYADGFPVGLPCVCHGMLSHVVSSPPSDHIQRVTWPAVYYCLSRQFGFLFVAVFLGMTFKIYIESGNQPRSLVYPAYGALVAAVVSLVIFLCRPKRGVKGGARKKTRQVQHSYARFDKAI